MHSTKITQVESTLPPKKQFIQDDHLDELWDARGLKYRVDELHQMMLDRGLSVQIDRPKFRAMVKDILRAFLVEGDARIDPRHQPRQRFPKVF